MFEKKFIFRLLEFKIGKNQKINIKFRTQLWRMLQHKTTNETTDGNRIETRLNEDVMQLEKKK